MSRRNKERKVGGIWEIKGGLGEVRGSRRKIKEGNYRKEGVG